MSIQNRSVCKRLLLVFTVSLGVSFLGMGAEWTGFWGGWMGQPTEIPHYPNTEAYGPGRWQSPPIYYELTDTAVHAWTSEEKAVVQAAVAELNNGFFQTESDFGILEHPGARCQNCPVNIQIRWEDPSTFFRNWGDVNGDKMAFSAAGYVGVYLPEQVAPTLGVNPCPDLKAAGSPVRCSTVVLNWANPEGWFIDSTPEKDEEFELKTVSLCGQKQTQLKALPGGPAADKQDLYTVALHEICHAIGLIHSGGCDRNLLTSSPRDDDGRVMWEGYLEHRRILESRDVGKGERRHVAAGDLIALEALYPPGIQFFDPADDFFFVETREPAMGPPYLEILGSGITVDASTITLTMQVREPIPSLERAKGRLEIGYFFVIDTNGDAVDWGIPFWPQPGDGWDYWALVSYWPGEPRCFLDDLRGWEWQMVNPELEYTIEGRFLAITIPLEDLGDPEEITWFAFTRTDAPYLIVDETQIVIVPVR